MLDGDWEREFEVGQCCFGLFSLPLSGLRAVASHHTHRALRRLGFIRFDRGKRGLGEELVEKSLPLPCEPLNLYVS
jgi:hypothetical protein